MDNVHHLKQMHPFCISEQKRNAIGVSPIAIIYIFHSFSQMFQGKQKICDILIWNNISLSEANHAIYNK